MAAQRLSQLSCRPRAPAGTPRQRNEDAYLADDELGLFLVCDGVGGRARGEIASAEAADLIWEWIKREEPLLRSAIGESVPPGLRAQVPTTRTCPTRAS